MSRRSSSVLLADPRSSSRFTLQRLLEDAGFCVESVVTGSEVLIRCDVDPPDILIMDAALPDMDGFDVCAHIRHMTRESDLTVVIMMEPTDEMTRAYLGQMVEYAGGDYYFARPFDGRLLVHLLDDLSREDTKADDRSHAAFPTRVVWPTRRTRSLTSIG